MTTRVDLIPPPTGIEVSEQLITYLRTQFQRLVDGMNFNTVPTGAIHGFAGEVAPQGWFLCDGSFKNKTQYRELFELIGHTYNGGVDPADGTFKLPDGKGRVFVGKDGAVAMFDTLGETGGSRDMGTVAHDHTLSGHFHTGPSHNHGSPTGTTGLNSNNQSANHGHGMDHRHVGVRYKNDSTTHFHNGGANLIAEGPSGTVGVAADTGLSTVTLTTGVDTDHQHAIGAHGHTIASDGTGATSGPNTGNTSSSGSSGTDTNMQPYQVINYIIKY